MNSWKEEVKGEINTELVKEGGARQHGYKGEMLADLFLCWSGSEKSSKCSKMPFSCDSFSTLVLPENIPFPVEKGLFSGRSN